jgi:hypothetical protein
MTEADFGTFERAFRRLAGAFRLKLKPGELEDLTRSYFKVLDVASIEEVLAAGKVCVSRCRKFPMPVEWLEAMASASPTTSAPDVRVMSVDETQAYLRAERLHYEDEPCGCLTCQAAGVTHLPLRFVPDVTDDGRDERAMCEPKKSVVTAGHWAHGDELARWYVARDAFYATANASPLLKRNRLGFTYVPPAHAPRSAALAMAGVREPGEEG